MGLRLGLECEGQEIASSQCFICTLQRGLQVEHLYLVILFVFLFFVWKESVEVWLKSFLSFRDKCCTALLIQTSQYNIYTLSGKWSKVQESNLPNIFQSVSDRAWLRLKQTGWQPVFSTILIVPSVLQRNSLWWCIKGVFLSLMGDLEVCVQVSEVCPQHPRHLSIRRILYFGFFTLFPGT